MPIVLASFNGSVHPSTEAIISMNAQDNNTPIRDFIYTLPERILFDKELSKIDLQVYMIIRSFLDITGKAFPSNNWIANKLEIHRISVIRSINTLVNKKYIKRLQINGQRYLVFGIPMEEELVADTLPPSSTHATPPSSTHATHNISNINISNNNKTPIVPLKKSDSLSFENIKDENPHCITEEQFNEWKSIRKKPITERVWKKTNKVMFELATKGISPQEAFDTLLEKQWQGMELRYFIDEINFRANPKCQKEKPGDSFARAMKQIRGSGQTYEHQGNIHDALC